MADALNVVVIVGSLRKHSFNASVARALPGLAPAGLKLSFAPSFASFPFYNFDLQSEKGFPPEVTAFADAIRAADGVIIVSPEYNWTIPGALKNAIDWVSRMKDQPFKDKPVALQSASGALLGGSRMQYHMRMTMTYLNAFTFGTPEVIVATAQNKFDKDLKLTDETTRNFVKQQLAGFAKFIVRVKA
jgi:chromate reductase